MAGEAQASSKTADIAAVAELSDEAMGLLRPEIAPQDYVALLMS